MNTPLWRSLVYSVNWWVQKLILHLISSSLFQTVIQKTDNKLLQTFSPFSFWNIQLYDWKKDQLEWSGYPRDYYEVVVLDTDFRYTFVSIPATVCLSSKQWSFLCVNVAYVFIGDLLFLFWVSAVFPGLCVTILNVYPHYSMLVTAEKHQLVLIS